MLEHGRTEFAQNARRKVPISFNARLKMIVPGGIEDGILSLILRGFC